MPIFIPENDDLRKALESQQKAVKRANYYAIAFCAAVAVSVGYALRNV